MRALKNASAETIMDSNIGDDLYLAFLERQIEEVRNSIGILREAIIQMVVDGGETKQQSEALLSLFDEMICLKAIRKDLFDSLGSHDAAALPAIPLTSKFKPVRLSATRRHTFKRGRIGTSEI